MLWLFDLQLAASKVTVFTGLKLAGWEEAGLVGMVCTICSNILLAKLRVHT